MYYFYNITFTLLSHIALSGLATCAVTQYFQTICQTSKIESDDHLIFI